MSLDDLGRRAAHDLDRASDRLEPSLPTAGELVERGRRRRAMRSAAGLVVVLVVLLAGAAFAGSGGNDSTTDVASEGESPVPTDVVEDTTSTEPDECEQLRDEAVADAMIGDGDEAVLFACLEACNAAAGSPSDCEPASTASTSAASVPDSLDEGTTSLTSTLPPTTGTYPPDGGVVPPTPPPVEDPPTTPHTPPPPPPSTTTIPPSDHVEKVLVSGTVTAGPTCPVESPDDPCENVGIVATITFTHLSGEEGFNERTVTSGADGRYAIQLLTGGRYSVTATSDDAMSCDDVTVDISMAAPVTLDISCDTGIRNAHRA